METKRRKLPWWAIYNDSTSLDRFKLAIMAWRFLVTETQSNRIYGWTQVLAMCLNQPIE